MKIWNLQNISFNHQDVAYFLSVSLCCWLIPTGHSPPGGSFYRRDGRPPKFSLFCVSSDSALSLQLWAWCVVWGGLSQKGSLVIDRKEGKTLDFSFQHREIQPFKGHRSTWAPHISGVPTCQPSFSVSVAGSPPGPMGTRWSHSFLACSTLSTRPEEGTMISNILLI